ncbi:hypothetical protein WL02_31015 [Burkholderia ubonensis]|uniref:non-ribosomal peptide synthetase n=1 Tax=Burkholderia ubonensis TaxID=101571 RepID=UPI0007597DD6|nr:non-ribosomal peptide synthetase [Burkholderia ubonensis]KVX25306.1 hypothetical protein WL02_31015 [Burkholderia ubonensis]
MASFESIAAAGELVAAGFSLWADGGRLRYAGPSGAMTDALKARAAAVRPALIECLARDGQRLTPPSRAQQRIYAAHAIGATGAVYLVPLAWRVDGSFDARRAMACARTLAARHEVLRQAFVRVGGHLVGVVAAGGEPDFGALSVLTPDGGDEGDAVRAWLDAEAARPFDVARAPLWRVRVVYARDGSCHLMWVLHHLICDEWSTAQLMREFADLYRGAAEPAAAPVAYRDYVLWENTQSPRGVATSLLDSCMRRLDSAPGSTALPLRGDSRPAHGSVAFESRALAIDVGGAVARAAHALHVTEFVFLLSSFTMLLAHYGRSRDVALVTPVTARLDERFVDVVGPVQQLAVIAATIEPDCEFATVCARIAAQIDETFAPDYPPIEEVLAERSARTGGARAELPGTMFVKTAPAVPVELGDVRCVPVPLRGTQAKTTLLACIGRDAGTLHVVFEYRPALLEPSIVRQMLDDYAALVERCARDASTCVHQLTDALVQRRRASVPPQRPASRMRTVPAWFDEVAAVRPHDLAIRGAENVSYRMLATMADRIGRRLPEAARRPGACVAVWGRSSARMIAAMLAVMRAGACVAPFDADLPEQRIAAICRRDGIGVVMICDPDVGSAAVVAAAGIRVVPIDESAGDQVEALAAGLSAPVPPHPHSLAYVMYTSGSTGEPKGVGVSHRAFAAFVEWAVAALDLHALDAFNVLTHASFDVSLFEVFAPLVAGCPLHIGGGRTYLDRLRGAVPGGLAIVPSVLRAALAAGVFPAAPTHLFVAGEAFSPALVTELVAVAPHASVWNLYGPTEAVVYASAWRVASECHVPIGAPRDGVRCYVLRDDWTMLPDGSVGELAIGGLVAREYIGMPALTAARFVPDPFAGEPGVRMYLTGDLVRVNGDGALEYLGRRDRQLKRFGLRIEPEEIERALLEHQMVTAAVVTPEREGGSLVAFVEARDGADLEHALRRHCHDRLPRGMTPQRFVLRDALPRTAAGKIDVAALCARQERTDSSGAPNQGRASPATPTQRMLLRVWAEALGHDRFDIHTNFFEAGGHSLALLAVHDRLAREHAGALSVIDLFVYTTIAQLAARLDMPRGPDADGVAASRAEHYRMALRRHRIRHGNDSAA